MIKFAVNAAMLVLITLYMLFMFQAGYSLGVALLIVTPIAIMIGFAAACVEITLEGMFA